MHFFVVFCADRCYHELMKDKNKQTLDQKIAEANRKAAQIALINLKADRLNQ